MKGIPVPSVEGRAASPFVLQRGEWPHPRLLDWYLLDEVAVPFVLGLLMFVTILIGDTLYKALHLILSRGMPWPPVAKMLLFELPAIVLVALPTSTLLAVALAMNRLVRESEVVAMRVGGWSLLRILGPFLFLGGCVAVADFVVGESLAPRAKHAAENLRRLMLLKQPVPLIQPRVFTRASQETYIYIGRVDRERGHLYDLLVFQNLQGDFPEVYVAREAFYQRGIWHLRDCYYHVWNTRGVLVREGYSRETTLNLKEILEAWWGEQKGPAEMSLRELAEQIEVFAKAGVAAHAMKVKFHEKFTVPLMGLIFAWLAAVLTLRWASLSSYMGFLIAVMLLLGYYLLQLAFQAMGNQGTLPPFWAAWTPPLLYAALAGFETWRLR